ncbi:methyltransferase domain-containing protein [Streptomyces sp. K1PA1]|uniref:Methyltransferase domain-containing protein n=1 Tax=Streptomyces tropicalis TaxID=3034234 RepID=A0ABT6A422_9ACTN|nr:class I SAM-dependent methyltransferase [Streptomyces tropicalis]MDF3299151.1 methyltransferase domain-containing protein [Streptomyces tropicalis]
MSAAATGTAQAEPAQARCARGGVAGAWAADEAAGPYAVALRDGRGPLFLRRTDGWLLPLEVERWCAEPDPVDLEVLARCEGSVLDVGCGPGRLVAALAVRGRRVLGIDVSEAAVAHTLHRLGAPPRRQHSGEPDTGARPALRRSVFEPVPRAGRWDTALLVDGNIGIGGDPRALLRRLGLLVRPDGLLIAETSAADVDERVRVEVVGVSGIREGGGGSFPWARVGAPALLRHAAVTGWRAVDQWTAGGRSFAALRSRSRNSSAEPPKSTAVISSQRARKPSAESPAASR